MKSFQTTKYLSTLITWEKNIIFCFLNFFARQRNSFADILSANSKCLQDSKHKKNTIALFSAMENCFQESKVWRKSSPPPQTKIAITWRFLLGEKKKKKKFDKKRLLGVPLVCLQNKCTKNKSSYYVQ